VTKLNADGTGLVYSTYIGGSAEDRAFCIAVGAIGNAYVVGGTVSADFPTVHPLQPALNGGRNAFFTKLNADGTEVVSSSYLGGNGNDVALSMALADDGNVYLAGRTNSIDFPTVNPLQSDFAGGAFDPFVAKVNAAGSALVYSTYLGGSRDDLALGIAADDT